MKKGLYCGVLCKLMKLGRGSWLERLFGAEREISSIISSSLPSLRYMEELQDFLTNGQGIALLDGGQATHLESLGHDLSGPLWSATLLATAAPRTTKSKIIQSLHDDYALAGADMVGTLTYQLSNKACQTAAIRQPESTSSENQDEYIDGQVREWFHRAIGAALIPGDFYKLEDHKITSVCLGPYGAALANGAEYTGEYPDMTFEDLVSFHLHRLRQAASSPAFFAMKVLAFETIPRLDEAEAICEALNVFTSEYTSSPRRYGNSPPPAYLSFVFPPEAKERLPWPAEQTSVDDIVKSITQKKREISWPIAGIGINCTKPWIMEEVVPKLTEAVRLQREANTEAGDKLQLFVSIPERDRALQ